MSTLLSPSATTTILRSLPEQKTARPPLKGAGPIGKKLMLSQVGRKNCSTAVITVIAAAAAPRSRRALSRRTVTRGALPWRAIAGSAVTRTLANHRRRDPQRFLAGRARGRRAVVLPGRGGRLALAGGAVAARRAEALPSAAIVARSGRLADLRAGRRAGVALLLGGAPGSVTIHCGLIPLASPLAGR